MAATCLMPGFREDRINLIYADAGIRFDDRLTALSAYTDKLRNAAFGALAEEAVLVVASRVLHSEP